MKKLKDVQRKNSSHDWIRLLTFSCFIAPVFLLLCFLSKTSKCDHFQIAMKNWLDEFNKVLKSKGVYVKAFTFKQMRSGGEFSGDATLSILCFALDSAEIDRLKNEPALQQGNSCDPNWGWWCCPAHQGRVL